MLTQIHIQDLATIEQLQLNLPANCSMITGETGAGKSIFLEALELALGARGSANMIRPGKERADISLCFDLSHFPQAVAWLKAHDLHLSENECIIRRVLSADGRSRSYINGLPATQQSVRDLGEMVFHLHGQYDQQVLFKSENQRDMLDRYAEHTALADTVREHAEHYKTLTQTIENLREKTAERQHRTDYLRFQLDEFSNLNLQAGEWEVLEAEHHRLTHSEALLHDLQHALSVINHDEQPPCLNAQLNDIRKRLENAAAVDIKAETWVSNLNSVSIQLADLEAELNDYIEHTDLDPNRLETVEKRISQLYDLARKHKIQPQDLLAFQTQLQTELDQLNNGDASLESLLAEQAAVAKLYLTEAAKLSKGRQKAAPQLAKIITKTVRSLSLPHAEFQIQLDTDVPALSPHGAEKICFIIKTNPDQPMQPIAKVVSGGELSRLSLAAHLALAHVCSTPTLIFDEVDTGVGGATAEKIGKLLRELGDAYQVFCVTHQPQVAACGHHHLLVEKQFIAESTHTRLRYLTADERRHEIARMLGGEKITDTTRAHAEEMLAAVTAA
jgi:DNA repair protein RecN (Recombination protein N)